MAAVRDDGLGLALSRARPPVARADDIGRARLVARLPTTGDGRRLTLVLAPAGWGKTTLLAHWAGDPASPPIAFLAVGDADNEPATFLAGLTAALGAVVPDLVDVEVQPSASAWIDYTLPSIVDRLAANGDRLALAIDDYHLISEPDIHIVVQAMLERLPPTVHLVISSRIDPPLRLGRLRASREVEEVRLADLRFSPDETATLLRSVFELDLDEPSIAALHDKTEGWAAGVSLAGIPLSQTSDPAAAVRALPSADRLIFDFLSEETLAGLAPELRRFLVTMSITDQFDVELSAAITGDVESAALIAELERRNLLVVTLAERRWYRFHQLFRTYLLRELRAEPAELVGEHHRRAGEWFAANGEPLLAVDHLIEGGAFERAVEVLTDHNTPLLVDHPAAVLRWIERLPAALLDERPDLYLGAINSAFVVESSSSALGWIDRFEERGGGDSEVGRYVIQAQRMWGLLLAGQVPAAALLVDDVMDGFARLTAAELATASPFGDPGMGPDGVAIIHALAGDDEAATRTLHGIVERHDAERWPVDLSAISAHGLLGQLAWLSKDLTTARSHIERAHAMFDDDLMAGFTLFSRAMAVLLDPANATPDQLERILNLSQRFDDPLTTTMGGLAEVAYRSARGDVAEARMALAEVRDSLGAFGRSALAKRLMARTEAMIEGPDPVVDAAPDRLTDRELQVLRALTGRLTQREIGRELYLSFNTVKTYSRSLYRKLGVRSRTEAVARARELRLI